MLAEMRVLKKIGMLTEKQKMVLAYGLFTVLQKNGIYKESELDTLISETRKCA